MFKAIQTQETLSRRSIHVAVFALILSIALALAEGVVRGPLGLSYATSSLMSSADITMTANWCYSLRNIAETVMSAAVLVFVAAKIVEGRTILTIGFDKLDANKVSFKGPDENNIVWIGHRYGSKFEADAVAATLENRLKESTA